MKEFTGVFMLCWLLFSKMYGQGQVIIVKANDPKRSKTLTADNIVEFRTVDSIAHFNSVVCFKQNKLWIKSQKCISERKTIYLNADHTDSTFNKYFFYSTDTIGLPADSIISLNYFPKKNKRWPISFSVLAAMSIACVISIPLNAINHREKEEILENTKVCGALIAITLPPALIGNRRKNFDLQKKWKFNQFE